MRGQAVAVLICAVLYGCGSGPAKSSSRSLITLQYDTTIAHSLADDTTLLMPAALAASSSFIAVTDEAGPSIRILSPTGSLRRVMGRQGGGPGELHAVSSVSVWRDSLIAVSDSRNRRLSIYGATGELLQEIPMSDGRLGVAAFDSLGRLYVDRLGPIGLATDTGSATIQLYGRTGKPVHEYGDYQRDPTDIGGSFLNQARFAAGPHGAMWLLMRYQGTLQRLDAEARRERLIQLPAPAGQTVDGPFTQVGGDDRMSFMVVRMPVAQDVAADADGNAYVLEWPMVGDSIQGEILAYDSTGASMGRARLLHRAWSISVSQGRLYALVDPRTGFVGIDVYAIEARPR